MRVRLPGLSLGLARCSGWFGATCVYAGGMAGRVEGWTPSFEGACMAGGGCGLCTRGTPLGTMDWVDEVPDRELPDRDEEREFGFTSLAFGASASSL